LSQFVAPNGRLIVTFPNILNPFGWFYFLGSRFTVPAIPCSPASARRSCQRAGFIIEKIFFTLPAIPMIGYTMVISLSPQKLTDFELSSF
jgi:hypothetical protein